MQMMYCYGPAGDVAHWKQELEGTLPRAGIDVPPLPEGASAWVCAAIGALVMAVPFLFATQNAALFDDLKNKIGLQGYTVPDFWAGDDQVAAARAGMDLAGLGPGSFVGWDGHGHPAIVGAGPADRPASFM